MEIRILNEPKSDYIYEFTVVKPIDEQTYEWLGYFEAGWEAEEYAKHHGGIILHEFNVRHKRKRR